MSRHFCKSAIFELRSVLSLIKETPFLSIATSTLPIDMEMGFGSTITGLQRWQAGGLAKYEEWDELH